MVSETDVRAIALSLPGTDVQLMLDANDPDAPGGPLFVVESVERFHAARPDTLGVIEEPSEIPGKPPEGFPKFDPAKPSDTDFQLQQALVLAKAMVAQNRASAR